MATELKIFHQEENGWTLPVLIGDGQPWFVLRYVSEAVGDKRPSTVIKTEVGSTNYRVFPKASFKGMKNAPARGFACLSRKGLSRYFKHGKSRWGSEVCEWVKHEVLPDVDPAGVTPLPAPAKQHPCENTFHHEQFGDLTVMMQDGEPWFIANEVAQKLGYANPRKAMRDHLDEDDKGVTNRYTLGGPQNTTIINESGLYSLILRSKLPAAKQFKRWVTSEVLPSIRKHGAYMTPDTLEQVMSDPQSWITLLQGLADEKEKNKQLAAANAALARKENTWDPLSVLNALIRWYAIHRKKGVFAYAWLDFYRRLEYRHGINVNIRAGKNKGHKRMVEYLRPEELPIAISLASAMCEEAGGNVGDIINKTNAAAYAVA